MVNRQLSEAERLQDIEDCVDEWGSSFDAIHPATAFTQASRVVEPGENATPLLSSLAGLWAERLDTTGARQMSNVLLACARLGYANEALWSDTLAEYLQRDDVVPQDLSNTAWALAAIAARNRGEVPGVSRMAMAAAMQQLGERMDFVLGAPSLQDSVAPQALANLLWAYAKLRLQPGEDELGGLLKAFTRPSMLGAAAIQAIANLLWALSELHRLPDWQGAVKPRVWERLLAQEQVARLADNGKPQDLSNALLALGRLGAGAAAPIAPQLAQQAALQLLKGKVARQLAGWPEQAVSNSMWACVQLGLCEPAFLAAVAASADTWVPKAAAPALTQVAWVCVQLQFKQPQLLAGLLQRGKQLAQGGRGDVNMAATLAWAMAALDQRQLAREARALVAAAHPRPETRLHPAEAGRLWLVHAWLVQGQLLDGQGLAGLVSPQQLAAGQAAAPNAAQAV